MNNVWLNANQVAQRLDVSRRTALALMHDMKHSVIGGDERKRIRVSERDLEDWMERKSSKWSFPERYQAGSKRKLKRREV